jgi:hypothetical protein
MATDIGFDGSYISRHVHHDFIAVEKIGAMARKAGCLAQDSLNRFWELRWVSGS